LGVFWRDKLTLMEILRDTPEFKPSEVVAEGVIDSYLRDP